MSGQTKRDSTAYLADLEDRLKTEVELWLRENPRAPAGAVEWCAVQLIRWRARGK